MDTEKTQSMSRKRPPPRAGTTPDEILASLSPAQRRKISGTHGPTGSMNDRTCHALRRLGLVTSSGCRGEGGFGWYLTDLGRAAARLAHADTATPAPRFAKARKR